VKRTRMSRESTGEPAKCGMCGHPVYTGLRFGPKGANQAMTPAGVGRIHVDKKLCKAMEKMTSEELERPGRTAFPEARIGRDHHDAARRVLHPLDFVGVDQDGDGR
jgi:hypothetical protein